MKSIPNTRWYNSCLLALKEIGIELPLSFSLDSIYLRLYIILNIEQSQSILKRSYEIVKIKNEKYPDYYTTGDEL